jgi:Protein of unknown function (DUF1697)
MALVSRARGAAGVIAATLAVGSLLSCGACWDRAVARFVAFLRAVNLGERRVAMPTARTVLQELGFDQVSSYANSGNLLFNATGTASAHEAAFRAALEDVFGLELTRFVHTARSQSRCCPTTTMR